MSDLFKPGENALAEHMNIFRLRVRDVIEGDCKFLFVGGPPGIGKSFGYSEELRSDAKKGEAAWASLAEDERPERRTMFDEIGFMQFKPRYHIVESNITPPELYIVLLTYSGHDEIVIFDDISVLRNAQVQKLVMAATEEPYRVGWRLAKPIKRRDLITGEWIEYPQQFTFHGSIIMVSNHTAATFNETFEGGFKDRAMTLFIPQGREEKLQYVDKMAFAGNGLLRYCLRRPKPHGAGFIGTTEEALVILKHVREVFYKHLARLSDDQISLRLLQKATIDRAKYGPDGFEAMYLSSIGRYMQY